MKTVRERKEIQSYHGSILERALKKKEQKNFVICIIYNNGDVKFKTFANDKETSNYILKHQKEWQDYFWGELDE